MMHFFHIHLEAGFDGMDIPTLPKRIGERVGIEYSTAAAKSDETAVLALLFTRIPNGGRRYARGGCITLVMACKANDGGN